MDTKTLLIAALAVSLTTSLCMAIIFWTRRTYPGFGLWVAGHFCLVVSVALFILPRDHFPPWLTIILANYLWFAAMMLNNRGNLVFRGRRIGYGWEMAASVSFCVLFPYFTVLEPNITARLTVIALYHGGFQLWTVAVLLMRRPAYFGSSDVLQVVSLGILLVINIMRAGSLWISGGPIPHQVIALQPFIDMILLGTIVVMLVLTLSQIIMNTQRLEYDYRIAQERLELALDGSNTGLYAAHLLTGETFVDERHQRLLGYRPGEVVFTVQNWLEHIHPQDQPALLERYEEVAKGSRPTFESEYRVRHRDGTWRWVLDRGKSFDPDALGCPRRVTGTLMDITERKQAEAALRESEEKFRQLFKVVPIPLCFANAQGILIDINDRFVQVFGYTLDDVPTLNEWWLLAYPDENYRTWVVATWNAAVQKSARDGSDIASVEYRVTGKDQYCSAHLLDRQNKVSMFIIHRMK
jgi:PAS domain S-box-containing protein